MNTKENDSKLVPEVQRQYRLLREFNLEQAQNGETFTYHLYYEKELKYLSKSKDGVVFAEDSAGCGMTTMAAYLKMKPLCWVDGKPVYKGDKLWYKSKADNNYYQHEAWSITSDHLFDEGSFGFVAVSLLTWDKPHVHQDLIDAWNNGAEIQVRDPDTITWQDVPENNPFWIPTCKYRIKPKKKSGWINLWKPSYNRHPRCLTVDNTVCSTKDVALTLANIHPDEYITTIEIHWEE